MTKGNISRDTYESFLGAFTGHDWVGYRPGSQIVDDRMLEMMMREEVEGEDYVIGPGGAHIVVCNNLDFLRATATGRELRRRIDLAKSEGKPENYYLNHGCPPPE